MILYTFTFDNQEPQLCSRNLKIWMITVGEMIPCICPMVGRIAELQDSPQISPPLVYTHFPPGIESNTNISTAIKVYVRYN